VTIVKIPGQTESSIGKAFVKKVKELNPKLTVWKLSGDGRRDLPDYVCLFCGLSIFVELKRPGQKPTERQANKISELQSNGFPASWFDNAEKAATWVTETFTKIL